MTDMAYFAGRDERPAQVCRDKVAESDVFVLIAGFRYGSPVREEPGQSYTELEYAEAGRAGLPRLVFILSEDMEGPRELFVDLDHGARQLAFRSRLNESGLVTAVVASPEGLETAVLQALNELPRAKSHQVRAGRVWNVPARPRTFIGRDALLSRLESALAGGRVVVRAMHGMGGVGKTTAAIEYAHRHAREYDVVWWIASEDPTLIPEQLAGLARVLGLGHDQEPADATIARLLGALQDWDRWLLIFDNAEDPTALNRFLPGGAGHVLITSRNPDWARTAVPIEVDVFEREESIALLQSRHASLSRDEAVQIAGAVGDLPLVVDQAAGLLADTGIGVTVYLELVARRSNELLGHSLGGAYLMSVAASWTVAFDQLETDDLAAYQLLTLIAWLAPEPVPRTLLSGNSGSLPAPLRDIVGDPLSLAEVTGLLRRRGISRNDADGILLHRVPAVLLRRRSSEDLPDQGGWAAVAVRLMRSAVPPDPWNNPSVWPLWQPLLSHVIAVTDAARPLDAVVHEVAWLLERVAHYLQARGHLRPALPHFERAHRMYRDHLDDDNPELIEAANNLAGVLTLLGEYARAQSINEDIVMRRRRVLGEDHPDTLRSVNNLATTSRRMGEVDRARELDEDTLARLRRVLGDDHWLTMLSAHNVASDLRASGEHERARALDEENLARRQRVLGEQHPHTLSSIDSVASDLRASGDFERARALDEEALARRRRVLGEEHPDTLSSIESLASDLRASGDFAHARVLGEEVFTRRQRVLGEGHPDTLASAENLADDLRRLGEFERAGELETVVRARRV